MKRSAFFWHMVLSSVIRRRARLLTALLAVGIGAAMLYGLAVLSYDVPKQMGREFRSYGANLIVAGDMKDDAIYLKILHLAPKDALVGAARMKLLPSRLREHPVTLTAADFDELRKTSPYWDVKGEYPAGDDEMLLGRSLASAFNLASGDRATLVGADGSEREFRISGIVQTGGREDELVFVRLQENSGYDIIECSLSLDLAGLERLAGEIRGLDPRLSPHIVKRLASSEAKVLGRLRYLVWIVSLVAAALTMVSVSTTMMASVAERRKEIGLRKALGASGRHVMTEFMAEAALLGLLGGALGVGAGQALAHYVSMSVFARGAGFQPVFALATVLAAVLVTIVACIRPVRRAAAVDPAVVLRGE
ncbi:MAG: FtsX-like permease family protein [Succinivibrionaceae bacterium]|nr:FtsX-like permease family protein [Succinivibrionaceae bacterium]